MLFYHCFFTDLPDQFVEANSRHLTRWTDKWRDNPYLAQSRIIDGVQISLIGKAKTDTWPTLKCASERMLDLWLHNKGANYHGGYWGTLAEDQRDPTRKSGVAGRDDADDGTIAWISPGSVWYSGGTAARSGRSPVSVRQLLGDMADKPKPALKRDGVVAGEIVGYRCWRVEKGLLRSVYQKDFWRPLEILAGRELGDWDSRGIHAWKDAGSKQYHDYIRAYLNDVSDPFRQMLMWGSSRSEPDTSRPAMVTGTVFLWGDVVEHERGWRAEYARVRSLDWLYPDATTMGREEESLSQLRAKYGVLT